jgi:UrcA family protein
MHTLLQTAAQIAACAVAAACLATTAFADPLAPDPGAPGRHGPIKVLVIVSSHGLNLSTEAGADLFMRRIETAIDRACNDRPQSGALVLDRSDHFHACRAKALESAMAYVHSPLVRHRYAQLRRADQVRVARR